MKSIHKVLLIGVISVLLLVLVSCEKDEKNIKEKYDELKSQYEASLHKIAELEVFINKNDINELSSLEDANKELESKLYEENDKYVKSLQRIAELEAYIKNNKNNDLVEVEEIINQLEIELAKEKDKYEQSLQTIADFQVLAENFRTNDISQFEMIINELENETIHTMVLKEAYEEMESLKDKSFRYLDDGTVVVKNSGRHIANKWDEAIDINEHYQSIIEKFVKLYNMKKEVISDDDLVEAGFMLEVTFYGFGAIYGDCDELYKSYSRNYAFNRQNLEYTIEKYKNGTASADEVNEKYMEYKKAKEELKEYILMTVHGDL